MLVHLHVLALAAIALHQLHFAGDGGVRRAGHAASARIGGLTLQQVGGVGALERRQPAAAQLPDPLDHVVEEGAVVRGNQQRPGAANEGDLQPLEGGDIEVVGGLVEHQQVGVGRQQARQGHASLLATGERRGTVVPVAARDAQPGQRLLHPLVEVVAVGRLEALAQAA